MMETSSEAPAVFSIFKLGALSASGVGLWMEDVRRGRIRGDTGFAKLCNLSATEAANGVSLRRVGRAMHASDWPRALRRRSILPASEGTFELVIRAATADGTGRCLLWRGRYAPGQGYGVVLDITRASREGTGAVGRSAMAGVPGTDGRPVAHMAATAASDELRAGAALDQAVAHALAAREALGQVPGTDTSGLLAAVDLLLFSLGRVLGRELAG